MKNKIDLSKINIKKTPHKWITANFEGEEKKYEIRALTDSEKVGFVHLLTDSKDVFRLRNTYVTLLTCGLEIPQEVAVALYENSWEEATRIGDMIFELSEMFEKVKIEEAEEAEKNFSKETKAEQE